MSKKPKEPETNQEEIVTQIESPEENTVETSKKPEDSPKKSPIKLITIIVFLISLLFFTWYILSERHTPYTDQARIKGLITPIVPRVSGNVTEINTGLHKLIQKGDTLFQLDKTPFLIAIAKAEANIENTTQSVSASGSTVKSAKGKLGVAQAQLERAERNWKRVEKVMKENSGALSANDVDQAETSYLQAIEQVASAEANLERSRQSLGDSGPDNPKIRAARNDLEQAKLNLEFATIVAPTNGVIESFNIDLGYYAATGQPLATLISSSDIWIQADMKENNLSLIEVGDSVKFTFDIAPGKIFEGKIRSMGFGVSADETNKGGLPTISSKSGWLRDPQRFPIIIDVKSAHEISKLLRLGGQVDVVVYTGDHTLLNALANFRISLNSWLSYVR
ncbi:MAG: HlyD family secretion protein [Flavobacteriaceae bacterium]|nr:HlyD family secretion protein [Flavobacteriaceae bacterium]